MAQTARIEAEKATSSGAELGRRTADKGADVAHETIDTTEDTVRRGFEVVQQTAGTTLEVERAVARRSAEGTVELGQVLTELLNEQTRHNVEILKALTGMVDWSEVARIQGEFLRASLERGARLTQRYLEVTQAVLVTAASTASDQVRKAA